MSRTLLTAVVSGVAILVVTVGLLGAGLTTAELASSGCPTAAATSLRTSVDRSAIGASAVTVEPARPGQPEATSDRHPTAATEPGPERAAMPGPRRCARTVGESPGPVAVSRAGRTVELPRAAGIAGTLRFPNDRAATAAAAALSQLGVRYSWGGGTATGPTLGIRDGGTGDAHGDYRTPGFDCSGLTLYAYAQADIALPRVSRAQQRHGPRLPWSAALPGDLLFWGDPAHHVALYLGAAEGRHLMIEAPHSGAVVRVTTVRAGGDFTGLVTRPHQAVTR